MMNSLLGLLPDRFFEVLRTANCRVLRRHYPISGTTPEPWPDGKGYEFPYSGRLVCYECGCDLGPDERLCEARFAVARSMSCGLPAGHDLAVGHYSFVEPLC